MELPGIAHAISEIMEGACQAAAARVRAGRVHQREVGVDASLSVLREYNQQRRTFREAVCEERAGAAAGAGASRQARGVILSTGQLRKSKGESVSGAEWRRVPASRSAVETNSLDRYTAYRTRWFLPSVWWAGLLGERSGGFSPSTSVRTWRVRTDRIGMFGLTFLFFPV